MVTNLPEATLTPEESAYRAKYFRDISSVKKRDLFCTSCGNRISFEADNYNSHPFLGILQCQPCSDQFKLIKSTVKPKAYKKRCLMCGSETCQTLFPCPVKDCPYSFCKQCIKRNAASALLLADTTNWKCFVCMTNPLWEARGKCATLMQASPRRRKKDRLVRAVSTDTDEDIEDIKNQQKSLRNTRNRPQKSTTRKEKRKTRSVSKSSNHPTEDSDDDIEIISETKTKKKSPRSRRRKMSSDRSTNRSETPEIPSRHSRASSTQPARRGRAASTESRGYTRHKSFSLNRQNSDSSSGKEFTQSKVIRESFVSLQRLSIGEKDFTHSPDESGVESSRTLSKQEAFSLKNNLQDYVKEMKNVAKKILEEAELLQRTYTQKETLKPQEATKLVLECKNRFSGVKERFETNEKKFVTKFSDWCRKAKVKNIFVSLSKPDVETPGRLGSQRKKRSNEVVPQSSSDEEENDDKSHHSRVSQNSREATPEVSDCDEEVFTQDEAKSAKRKNESRSSVRDEKVLSPVQEEANEAPHSDRPASTTTNDSASVHNDKTRENDHDESSNDIFAEESDVEVIDSSKTGDNGNLSDSGHMSEEEHVSPSPVVKKKSTIFSSESSDKENSKRNREKEDKDRESRSRRSSRKSSDHSTVENDASADEEVVRIEKSAKKKKKKGTPSVDADDKASDDERRSKRGKGKKQKSGKSPGVSDAEETAKKSSKSDESTDEEKKSAKPKKKRKKRSKSANVSETEELPSKSRERKRKRRSSSLEPSDTEKRPESTHLALNTSDDEEESKKSREKKRSRTSSPKVSDAEEAAKQKLLESGTSSDDERPKKLTDHARQKGVATPPLPDAKEAKDTAADSDASSTVGQEKATEAKGTAADSDASSAEEQEEAKEARPNKSKKSPVVSEAEERAKQSLLNSDSSEDLNESDQSTKKRSLSAASVADEETKEPSPTASDAEERARAALLNSDTSEDEAKTLQESEKSEEKKKKKKKKSSPVASDAEREASPISLAASDAEQETRVSSPAASDAEQEARASSPAAFDAEQEARASSPAASDAEREARASSAAASDAEQLAKAPSPVPSDGEADAAPVASDAEERAKESLQNSDQSTDEIESPKKSKKNKETSPTASEVEEKAKQALLDSDSSSDETEKIELPAESQTDKPTSADTTINEPEEQAKSDITLNSSANEAEEQSKLKEERAKKQKKKKNKKGSKSDLSAANEASDPEERAKQALLQASDDSSDKAGPPKKSKPSVEESVMRKLLQSSDSEKEGDKEKEVPKKTSGRDSDKTSDILISPRARRRKFNYKNNEYYKSDAKLRQRCTVKLVRLPNRILRRHARALKKSKEYLENKELASLTALDRLEKIRKRDCGNDSSDSDGTSTSRIKKKTSKEASDTLMDHLNVNGENQDSDIATSSDDSDGLEKTQKSGDLQDEVELTAKDALLESSDEEKLAPAPSGDDDDDDEDDDDDDGGDGDDDNNGDNDDDDESSKKKKNKSDENKSKEKSDPAKAEKSEWKRSKLLTMKLSSSDSEEQTQKAEKKIKRLSQNVENSDNSENVDEPEKKKKRVRRRRLDSDSDVKLTDETSSEEESKDSGDRKKADNKKPKKRAKKVDNSSDSSSTAKSRPKPKRRRVRTAGTDSDSNAEERQSSQSSPNKGSGRKNIRKVLKDKQVADDTKQAAKQEEERLKRMAERQKLYNEMYEARLAGEEKVDKLILDFDEESKEELLTVHEGLVKRLKPHQAQGIKFMWDACFESLERATTTKGSGCILAHCMGLGKSFQVVTLTHTLLVNSEKTGVNTVLVVCPLSTVLNWANEFKIWLSEVNDGNDVEVWELTKFKKNYERKYQLEQWQKHGGVLIIGYEMYRNLSNPAKKLNKKLKESFFRCLVEPGPDLVVCDEGHLLKSESTAISKAMTKIRTLRRIVLTGTPLQNNLAEYHCMVQFVKPNLLGTKKEFLNRFVNPIQNGQFDDSTEYDVKLMKKRAHVLHKMLEGSVQRFDYSVLTPFLPPKQEYVIFVKLSEVQIKLYQYYIDNLARRQRAAGGSLFADFQALQRVWTHPIAIKLNADKTAEKKLMNESDSEGSLRDFIDDGSDSDSSSSSSGSVASTNSSKKSETVAAKRATRANPVVEEPSIEEQPAADTTQWWSQFLEDDHFEDLRISSKLRILFEILKESEAIGDKVLVFSQSLYSLTLIEKFLAAIDEETQKGTTSDFIDGHTGNWALGLDYFRLDGQTPTEHRSMWCKTFNKPSNTRARLFLISTRAGGLGINLTAANRVVIFDASWNPSHDVQSIFRIYRFGQKKPCYVYRLLAAGTMEEKIYNRQVTKLSLSCRVVDEQQIERHYAVSDLNELYTFDKPPDETTGLGCPKDRLLAEIFYKYKDLVRNYHEHDSLLENKADEELDEEERKQAWLEYEQEKAGRPAVNPMPMFNYQDPMMMQQLNQQMLNPFALNGNTMQNELTNLLGMYQKDFPNMTPEQQKMMATKALMEMYSYMENHHVMSNRVNTMPVAGHAYSNPTNTLANQLAQQAYTRHHQQVKQMNAAQKQIQYAQQFGNYKTVPVPPNPNVAMRHVPAILQQRATISHDPEIMEITPTTTASNSSAQSSGGQGEGRKNQEE